MPIDFSGASRQALEVAMPLADRFGARIMLLHVVPPHVYPPAFGVMMDNAMSIAHKAEAELASMAQKLLPPRLRGGTMVRTGYPATVIAETARRKKVDMIVLTTHGHTGMTRTILGSTAEHVVRCASCPVLTVRSR